MGMTWTCDQKKVIELRDRNILVSAAAGSGKTAVLVERILTKIIEDKVDIDRLLIVTFTNAAAAEMRERIRDAIEEKLEQNPTDTHLAKQATLVHHAQITTIDSFCLYVIRNYFHKIDLEPNFRVAEDGELALLSSDVLDQVLESYYEAGSDEFLTFVESYGNAKNDQAIRDMILKLHDYSLSYPWPMEWLTSCESGFTAEEAENSVWLVTLVDSVKETLADCLVMIREALGICQESDGPYMYEDALKEDVECLTDLVQLEKYEELSAGINAYAIAFPKLAAARKFAGDLEKKERVQAMRDEMKKTVKDLRDKYFFKAPEDIFGDLEKTAPMAKMLITLTKSYEEAFALEKRNKNLVDFSDMEHFALKILINEETKEPTETADEFAKLFDEIMIDEYQDSNFVQETLLKAISRERFGQNNLFMVGDVKQSIYRFRLARPELFMEKFDTYTTDDGEKQRIDLQKNFRSRKEVLDGVNDIFYQIMKKDLGNIVYDKEAALYVGADYPRTDQKDDFCMEVLVAEEKEENENLTEPDWDKKELEANLVATRIKKLLKTQLVTEKETGKLRPATYGDIVILLRSVSNYADTFVKVLMQQGIPAITPSKTGYFSTIEIQTVLNMLRIIDNPRQDIPLAAVLHSVIGGFSGEDLAKIKVASDKKEFYDSILWYVSKENEHAEKALVKHLEQFLEQLEEFRALVPYTPVHELLMTVLERTGYLDYITALPAGEQKRANVNMLIERAISYENTSYKGLFHFVRYIEKLHKYDVDYGEADIVGENDNAVRIMSIHKSKGLEFPIVFVSGMGKNFNMQDTKSRLILHPDFGIGLDYMDAKRRTKTPTLLKRALMHQTNAENRGEELRVLYVALTRAKEKLILTGCLKDAGKKLEEYKKQGEAKNLSYLERSSAMTFFDWVLPALYAYEDKYKIQVFSKKDFVETQVAEDLQTMLKEEQIKNLSGSADHDIYEKIKNRLSFSYPYEKEKDIRTKVSVSDIKHAHMEFLEEEKESVTWFEPEDTVDIVPDFIEKQNRENKGAMRGSAVHLAMQCLPFADTLPYVSLNKKELSGWLTKQLHLLEEAGRMDEEMYELIRVPMLTGFFTSDLARRMMQADERGELFREKAFVLGVPAKEIWDCDSEELVLVQGIVDAFFYEDDEIVIMDYKTDSVDRAEQLIGRYKTQLDLYERALFEATGKKVKEKIIYSFHLKQEIIV